MLLQRGSRDIEYIGSAHDHDEVELELLKTVARQRLAARPRPAFEAINHASRLAH